MSHVAVRGAVLVTAMTAATAGAWQLLGIRVLALGDTLGLGRSAQDTTHSFATALTGLCALGLLGCLAWLSLLSGAVLLDAVLTTEPDRSDGRLRPPSTVATVVSRAADRCPATLRRLLLAGCGTAVAAGLVAGPSTANPLEAPDRASAVGSLAGLSLPDRTVDDETEEGSAALVHVVRAGDCLWSVSAARLGPGATDAEIAATWRAIHRLNLEAIGPDPDLLHPGTALQLPADLRELVPDERKE